MSRRDWLPSKREDQLAMAKEWNNVLAEKATAWGIPTGDVNELLTLSSNADDALARVNNRETHTPVTAARCREAFESLIVKMRYIKDRYFKKPPLADHDFVSLGLNPKDNTRTEHIEVHERVALTLGLRYDREIKVDFKVAGAANKAKPDGYEGAMIRWTVLDHPPADQSELTNFKMASRTPYYIKFTEAERGKTVYVAGAWQNERGNLGDYSDIVSAVVP